MTNTKASWWLGLIAIVVLFAAATADDSAEQQAQARLLADSKRISAWEINEVHRRFIALCLKDLPDEVTVYYLGVAATDNGRGGQRLDDADGPNVGLPLSWHVVRDVVLFEFRLSTAKSKETIAQCTINGRVLYLNVPFVDKNRDTKVPLPELGGVSVRDVLQKIAASPAPNVGRP